MIGVNKTTGPTKHLKSVLYGLGLLPIAPQHVVKKRSSCLFTGKVTLTWATGRTGVDCGPTLTLEMHLK